MPDVSLRSRVIATLAGIALIACEQDMMATEFAPRGRDYDESGDGDQGSEEGVEPNRLPGNETNSLDEMLETIAQIGGDVDDPDRVCAGWEHSCAIDARGRARCWGSNRLGQATPPEELPVPLVQITCGVNFTCALGQNGQVACWGAGTDPKLLDREHQSQSIPPAGVSFKRIAASGSGEHVCGLAIDGTLECWGAGSRDKPDTAPGKFGQAAPPVGYYSWVTAGQGHSCAIRGLDRAVVCWGGLGDGRGCFPPHSYECGATAAPPGAFVQVTAGGFHTCGLREDGTIQCWGTGKITSPCVPESGAAEFECGQAKPPEPEEDDPFVRVHAGTLHTCAITASYRGVCWGWNTNKQCNPPPVLTFAQIAAGDLHSCGLRTDANVECWGNNGNGRAKPPVDFETEPEE